MTVQEWTDQQSWEQFLDTQPHASFQQRWAWGAFREKIGTVVSRYAAVEGDKLIGVVQVLADQWRFGLVTHTVFSGPVATTPEAYQKLLAHVAEVAQKQRVLFAHVESPALLSDHAAQDTATKLGFRLAKALQPTDTQLLDLTHAEAQLLQGMHEKTRYNIRLAEKRGVHVTVHAGATARDAAQTFADIQKQTTTRDRFSAHGAAYYQAMVEYLPTGMVKIYVAMYEGQPIAANLIIHSGDTATYLHGASADAHRNVMAPHLLQWRQIVDAKLAGLHWYDFFGIETPERPRQSRAGASWAGITRFKLGFGGQTVSSANAVELPVRKGWYRILNIRRSLR
ncbi:MAG: peptidoglycan bridge formation glycyltransferase FemA/FemB family protein [Patescibacteria group bacterium]|jgi:lipid II:glycine glycyltransferase (peptidoglycan interpeptide bridge formation enzyme)